MTAVLGQEFRSEALSPDLFRESMRASGAEMAYMECVAEHYADIAAHAIPGLGETFDNFPDIAGREPMRLEAFIRKHRAAFAYQAEAR